MKDFDEQTIRETGTGPTAEKLMESFCNSYQFAVAAIVLLLLLLTDYLLGWPVAKFLKANWVILLVCLLYGAMSVSSTLSGNWRYKEPRP